MARSSRIAGTLFWVMLALSALMGSIFMLTPALPLIFLKKTWYRKITDEMLGLWLSFAVALLELVYDVKIKVTGHPICSSESSVIIMNHRTRLDWLFFWTCLWRQGYSNLKHEKIVLKHELKLIPGAGWAMQCGCYIFVRRKWEEDKKILQTMLDYFKGLNSNFTILIFPEGTDFNAKSQVKSREFASKNGLKEFEYVLHPRTTGFDYIMKQLSEGGHVATVYDVTVAYPYNIPQNELALAKGDFPEEIVFDVTAHSTERIMKNAPSVQVWCQQQWEQKEDKLRAFYSTAPGPAAQCSAEGSSSEPASLLHPLSRDQEAAVTGRGWLVAALCYWLIFSLVFLVLLCSSAFARYYALACGMLYAAGMLFGGLELAQARLMLASYASLNVS